MKKRKKPTNQGTKLTVRINKSLDKYANTVLFPEKLAKAIQLLKGVKLP